MDELTKAEQRLLLADMAIHLLQTALKRGDIELDKLRNSLHAILTISDQFLPQAGLKQATANIYADLNWGQTLRERSSIGRKPPAIRRAPSNTGGWSPNRMRGSAVTLSMPASRLRLSGHSTQDMTTVSPSLAPAAA